MNYFITDDGLRDMQQMELSIVQKYGSVQAMKIHLRSRGVKLYGDPGDDDDDDEGNPVGYCVNGKVAILSVEGGTRTNSNWLTRIIGIPTYDDIKLRFQQAYEDHLNGTVASAVMSINSPGGQANGTNAMSKFISDFDDKIMPVIAHTSGMCASAAVWYGTAGSALTADVDADVGSIGAVNVFMSQARMLKDMGLDVKVTRSAPYKAVPNGLEKLDEKGQEVLTEEVQKWHNRFLAGLSGNIGLKPDVINKTIASGKVFTAQQALNLGLVKSLIPFEQLIANLNAKLDNSNRAPARA